MALVIGELEWNFIEEEQIERFERGFHYCVHCGIQLKRNSFPRTHNKCDREYEDNGRENKFDIITGIELNNE